MQIVKNLTRVELLANQSNLGLGTATAQATHRAKGDLLLIANPDIYFTESLRMVLDYAFEHPDAEWIMPALNPFKEGVYHNAPHWHRYPFFSQFVFLIFLDTRLGKFLTRYCSVGGYAADILSGSISEKQMSYGASCMILSRRLVEKIGGVYKSSYFLYWADADLVRRLSKIGAKPHYLSEAVMDHYGGYTATKLSPSMQTYLSARGKKLFEKDWGHSTRFFAAQFLDTIFTTIISRLGYKGSLKNKIVFLKGWLQ